MKPSRRDRAPEAPTLPFQRVGLMNMWSLVISPIRVFRMLQVPQGTAAVDHWFNGEVVFRRRGRCRPFQRPGIPRIISSFCPAKVRRGQVVGEEENCDALNKAAD